jgi:putative methionine-R-sulfoxide reductase with GAF domain
VTDPTNDQKLILGPFQGKVACTEILFGKGVCGAAAVSQETQVVKIVHEFPSHIACDSASNSEIVVPLVLPSGVSFFLSFGNVMAFWPGGHSSAKLLFSFA